MAQNRHSRMHRALVFVLIEAREAAGLSQRDLSERMERPVNFVHLVELGERMVAVPELPEYAAGVNLTAQTIVTRMVKLAESDEPIPPRVDARKKRKKRAKS
jgi:transcriptional regulator with XRE-family HTH domain